MHQLEGDLQRVALFVVVMRGGVLQQTESLIFIDEILAKCHKRGIKALSKHDSIVCRVCDKHKVTKIVCKVLNRLFGRYTYALDIDGEVFDLQPRRRSRISRVASSFVHTLFGMSGYALAYAPSYRDQLVGEEDEMIDIDVDSDASKGDTVPGAGERVRRFKFRG